MITQVNKLDGTILRFETKSTNDELSNGFLAKSNTSDWKFVANKVAPKGKPEKAMNERTYHRLLGKTYHKLGYIVQQEGLE